MITILHPLPLPVRLTLGQITVGGPPTTEPGPIDRFAEEHELLIGAVVLVAAIAVGIALLFGSQVRSRRARAMEPTAAAHGLSYSSGDLLGCTQVAFPLFRAGDGRTVENVMWRTGANGLDVRVFDFAYFDEYRDKNGGRIHKRWSYFNCAMARHNGLWPVLHVSRERVLDKVAQKLAVVDIELESEEFNRLFRVRCDDRQFATTLLHPQLMELLLATSGKVTFETKGRWLLVISPRLDTPAEMVGLLGVADEFLRRIPPVVWELYGEGADTDGGRTTDRTAPDALLLAPTDSIAQAMREERRDDWWDPTPGVEHDLDGNVIPPRPENPWG